MHGPQCLGCAVQETVEEMCKVSERPMILALSNPTSQAEITAEDAIHFSKGKAMFMSGSFRGLYSLYPCPLPSSDPKNIARQFLKAALDMRSRYRPWNHT